MSSEVKYYWPEELVGTGELVVYLTDYAALEAELAKLKGEYEWVASINTALDESNQSAWGELARLRAGQEPVGWLVSLELPEVQCNCAWNPDSHDKTCPVYLRDRMADAQRAIAELLEALENTATWIEQLPVPTVGAAGQLVKIDKAIAAAR